MLAKASCQDDLLYALTSTLTPLTLSASLDLLTLHHDLRPTYHAKLINGQALIIWITHP